MTDVHAHTANAAPGPETTDLDREATRPFGTGPVETTETGTGATTGPPTTGAGWGRWVWRQLTSMRTALILLFLLALGSVPGSILPQEGADPASVTQYFTSHPTLAPWLNRLGLFNVFAAPWFAAIYILLFASLVGCVVPRTFKLVGSARTPPPRAPRNLARLPHSATYPSSLSPDAAVDAAASVLGGQRFRLRRPAEGDSGHWLAAEKGYLREVGNLLFHLSLLGVLLSIALGGLYGYKADELVTEGQTFNDTTAQLAEFHPGRLVTGSDLAPFSLTLDKFAANYIDSGASIGQPAGFDAHVSYTTSPGSPSKTFDIQVNHPLSIDAVKVYLIGHGYAPEFKVTSPNGTVAYDQATPFIPANANTMLSDGVVKASSASLGFEGVFVPTAYMANDGTTLESIFPAANNPEVSLIGYTGNLGLGSGVSQSVYQLDTSQMKEIAGGPHLLTPGSTWKLPGNLGSITYVGTAQWASLEITHDPGQIPALVCGILALAGLLLSFFIRRRRVFVRAVPGPGGVGSIVTVGGLTRTDASGGFEDEFASLAADIADVSSPTAAPSSSSSPSAEPDAGPAADGQQKPEPNNQSETGA